MAYSENRKGGNCPKSKSSNWWTRKEIKESSSMFRRRNNKKEIEIQLEEKDIERLENDRRNNN